MYRTEGLSWFPEEMPTTEEYEEERKVSVRNIIFDEIQLQPKVRQAIKYGKPVGNSLN